MEVLHKQHRGLGHVHVVWKLPGSQDFVNIRSEHISSYMEKNADFPKYPSILKQHKVTHKKHMVDRYRKLTSSPVTFKVHYLRDNFNLLPKCNSSAQKIKLKRYESIHFVRTPKVYPADGSNNVLLLCEDPRERRKCKGNSLLRKKEASRIVHKYLKSALPK